MRNELRDASRLTDSNREDARGHRVQSAEVADSRSVHFFSDHFYDIMRGNALRLIDDENAVDQGCRS